MKVLWLVPVLASILILGVFAYSPISFADDDDDDDDFDDNPCTSQSPPAEPPGGGGTGGVGLGVSVGIHGTIAHVLDDDDDVKRVVIVTDDTERGGTSDMEAHLTRRRGRLDPPRNHSNPPPRTAPWCPAESRTSGQTPPW